MKLPFKAKRVIPRGKLIAIEGIAKPVVTTQLERLAEALTFAGFNVALAEFPQEKNTATQFRVTVLPQTKNPEAKAVLDVLDFVEAKPTIEKWLAEGTVVLTTGYVTSVATTHAAEVVESAEQIRTMRFVSNLAHEVFTVPRPDVTLILDTSAEEAHLFALQTEGAKSHTVAALEHIASLYSRTAKIFPQTRYVVSPVGEWQNPEDLHNMVWQLVRRIAFKNNFVTTR